MSKVKRIVAAVLAALSLSAVVPAASASHLWAPSQWYWARPTPGGDLTPLWKNLLFFDLHYIDGAKGWVAGAENARHFQAAMNTLLYGGAGSNKVPGATFPDHRFVWWEGDLPGAVRGDISYYNGYFGQNEPYCGGQVAVGCTFPTLEPDGTGLDFALVTLNDSYGDSYPVAFKQRTTTHESGHVMGLGHTGSNPGPGQPVVPPTCSAMDIASQQDGGWHWIGTHCNDYSYPTGNPAGPDPENDSDWANMTFFYDTLWPPTPPPPGAPMATASASQSGPIEVPQETIDRYRQEAAAYRAKVRSLAGTPFAAVGPPATAVEKELFRKVAPDVYAKWSRGEVVRGEPVAEAPPPHVWATAPGGHPAKFITNPFIDLFHLPLR